MSVEPKTPTHAELLAEKIQEVMGLVHMAHGFDLSCYDETFFVQSLQRRLAATATATIEEYLVLLQRTPAEARKLLESMDVVYSEFFRNLLAFALLEQALLPGIIEEKEKSGGELRVWSAGCATGQEAWSAAIMLDEMARIRNRPISYRIIATDRSESALAQARTGRYHIETMGNLKTRYLGSSFSRQGDFFSVVPRLRQKVAFTGYDLLDPETFCPPESIFGNFDLVFCCNVLLYYRPEIQSQVLKKIRRCLAGSGYLITDDTERRIVEETGDFRTWIPPVAVFQKTRCLGTRGAARSHEI